MALDFGAATRAPTAAPARRTPYAPRTSGPYSPTPSVPGAPGPWSAGRQGYQAPNATGSTALASSVTMPPGGYFGASPIGPTNQAGIQPVRAPGANPASPANLWSPPLPVNVPQGEALLSPQFADLFGVQHTGQLGEVDRALMQSIQGLTPAQAQQVISGLRNNPQFQLSRPIAEGQYAGEYGRLLSERRNLHNDYTLQGRRLGVEGDALQADLDDKLARLGLSREELGIDQAAAGRDNAYYQRMIDLANQALGLELQRHDLSDTTSNRERRERDRQLSSVAAGRGSFISQGFRDDLANSGQVLGEQLQGTNISRGQSRNQNAQQVAGLNRSLGMSRDTQRSLALQGRRYGLDEAQTQRAFELGMDRLGLDRQQAAQMFTRNIAENDVESLATRRNALDILLQHSGYIDNITPGSSSGVSGRW